MNSNKQALYKLNWVRGSSGTGRVKYASSFPPSTHMRDVQVRTEKESVFSLSLVM